MISPGHKMDLLFELDAVQVNLNIVNARLSYSDETYQLSMVVEQLVNVVKKIVEQI
jgi:hypothetical protein